MSNDVIILILSGIFAALVAALLAYLAGKKFEGALLAAIDHLLSNVEWVDVVEEGYDENVPEEVQALIASLMGIAERLAEGTASEADDRLVELLKRLLDPEEEI